MCNLCVMFRPEAYKHKCQLTGGEHNFYRHRLKFVTPRLILFILLLFFLGIFFTEDDYYCCFVLSLLYNKHFRFLRFFFLSLDELSNLKGCFHEIKRLQNSKTSSDVHPENGWKKLALGQLMNTVEHQAVTEPRSDQQMAQQTSQRMIKGK